MINLFHKIADYYLTKSLSDKMIFKLFTVGLILCTEGLVSILFQEWIKKEFNIELPNLTILGIVFIVSSIIWLSIKVKYQLLPSIHNTQKTTKIIYLGDNKYQFIFEKKMRCTPTLIFFSPKYSENNFKIYDWNENGFFIHFEDNKALTKIDFLADSWLGLNFRQKLYIKIINLFRKKDNKLSESNYADSFVYRQQKRINQT